MKFDKYHNVDNPILSGVVDFHNVQLLKVPSDNNNNNNLHLYSANL